VHIFIRQFACWEKSQKGESMRLDQRSHPTAPRRALTVFILSVYTPQEVADNSWTRGCCH